MKKCVYPILAIMLCVSFTSCDWFNPGIRIAGEKIPYRAACGSLAEYKCRAQGISLGGNRFYKERKNLAATNKYNIGRAFNPNPEIYDDTRKIFRSLKEGVDYIVEEGTVKADFKSKIIKDLEAELKAQLEEQKYSARAKGAILVKFHSELNSFLKADIKFKVVTLHQDIIDEIRAYQEGENPDATERIKRACRLLKKYKWPLIRQVFVIEENIDLTEGKSVANLLKSSIDASAKQDRPTGDIEGTVVISGMLSSEKTTNILAKTHLTSVYSYGFYQESWFLPPSEE